MLLLKEEYTLRFPKFLIIGLFNSTANYWFDIISLLIEPPEVREAADLFVCVTDLFTRVKPEFL